MNYKQHDRDFKFSAPYSYPNRILILILIELINKYAVNCINTNCT